MTLEQTPRLKSGAIRRPCRLLQAALLFFAVMLLPSLARPAEGLAVNVANDYGGYFRPGDWTPVIVSISNTRGKPGDRSADFEGQLVIESASLSEGRPSFQFARDVLVPSGSTLRFVLYARFNQEMGAGQPLPQLVLRTAAGVRVESYPLNLQPLEQGQQLMVTVSDETQNLYFPRHRSPVVNRPVQTAFMSARNLPEHWAAYDPVDILVFPKWPEGRVTERQIEALFDWVSMGGTLVFLGGRNTQTYSVPLASTLLPVEPLETGLYLPDLRSGVLELTEAVDTSSREENPPVVISRVIPDASAEVIYDAGGGAEELPLVVRSVRGRGQIIWLGADLESPGGVQTLMAPYWLAMMPPVDMLNWRQFLPDRLGDLKSADASPPNVVLIILICLLYTVAVGPVNFFLLTRMNRIQLAWVTVPVIVLAFTFLIRAYGFITRSNDTVVREVSLLLGVQDQEAFEELSAVLAFVPATVSTSVIPDVESHTSSDATRWHLYPEMVDTGMMGLADTGAGRLGFSQRPPLLRTVDEQIVVERWPMRTNESAQFLVRGPRILDGGLEANLTYHSSGAGLGGVQAWLTGSIENRTGMDFSDAAIVAGGRAAPVGPVASGETLTFGERDLRYPASFRENWLSGFRALDAEPAVSGGAGDDDVNNMNARVMLEAFFDPRAPDDTRLDTVSEPHQGRILFVGVGAVPDLTVQTDLARDSGTRAVVMVVELNPQPAGPIFHVPGSLVAVRLQETGTTGNAPMAGLSLQSERSETFFSMLTEGWAMMNVELPFHGPGIRPGMISSRPARDAGIDVTFDSQRYEVQAGFLSASQGGGVPISIDGGELVDQDRDLMLPWSGRAWVLLNSSEVEDDQGGGLRPTGIFSSGELILRDVDFAISGTVSSGD